MPPVKRTDLQLRKGFILRRLNISLLLLALCSVLLTALWISSLPLGRVARGENDFLAFYAGAKLVGTAQLYSAEAVKQIQAQVAQVWLPAVIYIRPPFYAAILKPFAFLPYRAAYLIFQALNLAAFASFLIRVCRTDPRLTFLAATSIPAATAFANGQDIMLLIWTAAIGWELERRQKHFLAGLVLSLLVVKFHIFIFLPIALVLQKRWKIGAGWALGTATLMATATALQGLHWVGAYLHFLQSPEITPTPITMPNLRGLTMTAFGNDAHMALIVEAALAAAVLILALYALAKSRDFGAAIALSAIAGLLIGRHGYVQDCCLLMLVPALFPLGRRSRILAFILLSPPVYFYLVMSMQISAAVPLAILGLFVTMAVEAISTEALSMKADPSPENAPERAWPPLSVPQTKN